MLMLDLTLQPQYAVTLGDNERRFGGGLMHGLFESALERVQPNLRQFLRSGSQTPAHYALKLSDDWAMCAGQGRPFHLGVVLFEAARPHWQAVVGALIAGDALPLSHRRTPCHVLDVNLQMPDWPVNERGGDQPFVGSSSTAGPNRNINIAQALNASEIVSPPVAPRQLGSAMVTIELLSPCLIDSHQRRANGAFGESGGLGDPTFNPQPLTLRSVIKSLRHRLATLEPTLYETSGLSQQDWLEIERTLGPSQYATRHNVSAATWFYRSRNTPSSKPVPMRAIMGRMRFDGPFNGALMQLLTLGQWLALGQKTTLGQGWFRAVSPDPFDSHPDWPRPSAQNHHDLNHPLHDLPCPIQTAPTHRPTRQHITKMPVTSPSSTSS